MLEQQPKRRRLESWSSLMGWVLLSPEAFQQLQVYWMILMLGGVWFMAGK